MRIQALGFRIYSLGSRLLKNDMGPTRRVDICPYEL